MNKEIAEGTAASDGEREFPATKSAPRLDAWLAERVPELSRERIKRLIEAGSVTVNGAATRPSRALRAGDLVRLSIPAPRPAAGPEAEDIALDVLHEDEHFVAINKPPGLVVHPGAGHAGGTLVSALLHRYAGRLSSIGGELRPGIVHRLDKETSGVIVVARTDAAHLALSRAFASREVEKHYLAVVGGTPAKRRGRWEGAIGRHPVNRKKMAVTGRGRAAVTLYRVLNRGIDWSLLHCQILTGRTHQIRVHASHAGHAIFGDSLYGRHRVRAPRCLLHAAVIRLQHPTHGRHIEISAPLPRDFSQYTTQIAFELYRLDKLPEI